MTTVPSGGRTTLFGRDNPDVISSLGYAPSEFSYRDIFEGRAGKRKTIKRMAKASKKPDPDVDTQFIEPTKMTLYAGTAGSESFTSLQENGCSHSS